MLIYRYLSREILTPLVSICGVLVIIFAGYSATQYLPDAANGLLTGKTVLALVALKVLIALELLIPVTLFLSVISVLARLHAESEIIALQASGIGERTLLSSVFKLSLLIALLVAALSLYVRPWAYEKSYWLKAHAKANFDLSRLKSGRFHEVGESGAVVFLQKIDKKSARAEGVFIEERNGAIRKVTRAREAWQVVDPATAEKSIVLRDGSHYVVNDNTSKTRLIHFNNTRLTLTPKEIKSLKYRRKAASTKSLSLSSVPGDQAEYQWRFSTGFATVLLGLLGIPLSRTAPRRGKSANVFVGVIIFAVFYNLTAMAKTWMESGLVGFIPGIWWPHLLLALLLVVLLKPFGSGFRS